MIREMKKLFVLVIGLVLILSFSSTETPGQPKTLIVGSGAEPLNLLPSSHSQPTMDRVYNIYEPLVFLSTEARAIPSLATRWETVDGNKKWRFHLRKGVVFHNGEKFSAEDVAFSIDYHKNPDNKLARGGYCKAYTYKIIDAYTIDIFREDGKSVPPLLPETWYCVQMLPKVAVAKMVPGELARKPIGTGPFQFVEWRDGEQVVLRAFDKYWGGKPKIERVIFKTIPELATRIVALKSGDVDLITDVPSEEVKSIQADPNLKILEKTSLYNMHLQLRCDIPPFKDDLNLRRAVAHAIDVEAVCKSILGGNAIPVGSVNSPIVFGYNKDAKPYKYDPELAKDYLKKSNYKGEEIVVQTSTGRYLKDIEINTAVERWLKAIGINATLKMYDWPTWINLESTRKSHPIYLRGWADNAGDGAENLFDACHSKSPYSWPPEGGIPGVDELVDLANTSFEPKVRKEAIEKANKLVNEYAYFGMNYIPVKVYGVRKNVKWAPRADETICFSPEDEKR